MKLLRAILVLGVLAAAHEVKGAMTVNLLLEQGDQTNQSTYVSNAFTPTANALVVIGFQVNENVSVTPVVSGVTTSQSDTVSAIKSHLYDTSTTPELMVVHAYKAAASPASTTVSVALSSGAATGANWQIWEVIGSDVANTSVASQFVQSPTTTADSAAATSLSITLAAAADSANRAFLFCSHLAGEATTPRTNWTEIGDASHSGPAVGAESQWRSDTFETTASASWTTSARYGGIALEIKALVAGGVTIFRNRTGSRARSVTP